MDSWHAGFIGTGDPVCPVAGSENGRMERVKEVIGRLIYYYRMGHGGESAMRRDDEKKRNNEQE